ncbi:phosphotransferase system HPr (HPr) family protein [Orenia metallireducens]|jgi:phosphocarrier protein|uniref:Phosphotransferase system HPr (HPr) family n=1 Tax=Orenia metallireducens TaxID=1413210 RepID=A0A285GZW7_9FIRM|nr:HPr family phosphocarrier protein [Orenia metallireducens]PRX31069.1 phosphotransferase system HPr (HPr) family protein [Orenia metallireducens]SNY27781.1 phosphotransferase system HPr (HPr) family [Orenia metallireducens]
MFERKVKLRNEFNLHARPASILVEEAEKYASRIKIIKDNQEADAKSILGLICLAVKDGEELLIQAEGNDAKVAVDRIADLIENKLRILSHLQDKKAVAQELGDEIARYTVPNPAEVVSMIGRGVRKTMESIGIDMDEDII